MSSQTRQRLKRSLVLVPALDLNPEGSHAYTYIYIVGARKHTHTLREEILPLTGSDGMATLFHYGIHLIDGPKFYLTSRF